MLTRLVKVFLLLPLLVAAYVYGADVPSLATAHLPDDLKTIKQTRLTINNRTLAKINGQVISLIDVVKRMDLELFDYNCLPDTLHPLEKYQHYMSRWQAKLKNMISDQLILLDAEEKEVQISDGKVRERLESRFGPNVMSNLDAVHLTYDEATALIRDELTVEEMTGLNVHAATLQKVTPDRLFRAYEAYVASHPPEDIYTYQVLSLRATDDATLQKIADQAQELLKTAQTLSNLADYLTGADEAVKITLSNELTSKASKLSSQHRTALESLAPNTFSAPLSQTSRRNKGRVFRIFYLKEHTKQEPTPFVTMQDDLRLKILHKEYDKTLASYLQKLKKRFGYDSHDPYLPVPDNYQPFTLT